MNRQLLALLIAGALTAVPFRAVAAGADAEAADAAEVAREQVAVQSRLEAAARAFEQGGARTRAVEAWPPARCHPWLLTARATAAAAAGRVAACRVAAAGHRPAAGAARRGPRWSRSGSDDEATAELMVELYRGLAAGRGRAEALRRARARLAAQPRFAHPFYWAAFVLNGNPRPLSR
jgi:hypothetical protein